MLGRGLDLLKGFSHPSEELSLAELTRRVDLPKPTVYRLAGELVSEGLLDPTTKGFRLGHRLFMTGLRSSGLAVIRSTALPYLAGLFAATAENALLAALPQSRIALVEMISGRRSTRLPQVPGVWLPETSALGQVFNRCFGTDVGIMHDLRGRQTTTWPRGVATNGCAVQRNDLANNVVSVSAPVYALGTTPVAALGATGRLTAGVIPVLTQEASRLSQDLARLAQSSEDMWQTFTSLLRHAS